MDTENKNQVIYYWIVRLPIQIDMSFEYFIFSEIGIFFAIRNKQIHLHYCQETYKYLDWQF